MPAKRALDGRRFGKLLVASDGGRDRRGAVLWRCLCDCGKTTLVRGSSLVQGRTASCGCGVAERARMPRTHGLSKSSFYGRWRAMRSRCGRERNSQYHNYGGRGITVCSRWKHFELFYADMAPTFFEGAELDRKDTNGNYDPGNCRWVRSVDQQRNKRSNRMVTLNGVRRTLVEWSEVSGVKASTILARIRRGWPEHRLLEVANG